MSSRSERRQKRRDQIEDKAMQIIAEGGVDALTVAGLADEIGLSVGGLYRYFPSKESILVALQRRVIDAYGQAQGELLASVREDPLPGEPEPDVRALYGVIRVFWFYLEHSTKSPQHHRLLDAFISTPEPNLSDADAAAINEHLMPMLAGSAEAIERAVRSGALTPGDPLQRTHVLWAGLYGLDHFRKRDRIQPDHLKMRALAAKLFRTVLIGWGGGAEDVDRAIAIFNRVVDGDTGPRSDA